MVELSEAYVTGLLANVETDVDTLDTKLKEAVERAARIDKELSAVLNRADMHKRDATSRKRTAEDLATKTSACNSRISGLHQEIAALKKRAADVKEQIELADDGEARNRLRRERAKALVQIEDREADIAKVSAEAEHHRSALTALETRMTEDKETARLLLTDLDQLQDQLPSPHLYLDLFETRAARAHCHLLLDQEPQAFAQELRRAINHVVDLHAALRAGKYRLDKNSDILGGRATGSVLALYGAAVLGDLTLVQSLFVSIADPALLFDQIFNVFRLWCLGLYVGGHKQELAELLRKHQYAQGLRGGYVEAFFGLLYADARRINAGLKIIARCEWESWQDPRLRQGVGVVNLAATALARIASKDGLAISLPDSTVPAILVGKQPSTRSRATR